MRLAGEKVAEALAAVREGALDSDNWMVTSALERQLSIIGEAVKRLTFEFRGSHPEIDWRRWAGLRDIVVHAYDVVDVPQLWDIARTDVQELLDFLRLLSE